MAAFPIDFSAYQGLIFDLDGTLIDSMPFHVKAWQSVCEEHGFSIDESFIYDRGGFSSRNVVLDLQKLGHDTGDIEAFVKRKVQLYRDNMHQVQLFPQVFEILTNAKAKGAKIVIATGTQRINAVDILKIHHIEHLVDHVVSADDVQRHKPDPQSYLLSMELMNLKPHQCIALEDGKPGILAAKAAHLDCVEVERDHFVAFHKAQS